MKGKILGIVLLSLTPLSSFAADGDITFEGIITSSACTLNGFNGGNATTGATMILPMVNPASFLAGGGYAGMTDFTINLKDCDITTMKNARVTFSGAPDTVDNNILKNSSTGNAASGVGIAIIENDGSTLVSINGGSPSFAQTLTAGDNALKYKVAYKANTSTPAVTAGAVSAKAFVDIMYQ